MKKFEYNKEKLTKNKTKKYKKINTHKTFLFVCLMLLTIIILISISISFFIFKKKVKVKSDKIKKDLSSSLITMKRKSSSRIKKTNRKGP